MRFRPRYSLLTLLLLTALVAGGVKLWYGPHHVIDRDQESYVKEYTFTRDWSGNRIIHGPQTIRYEKSPQWPVKIVVFYYRHGVDTYQRRDIVIDASAKKYGVIFGLLTYKNRIELTAEEREEFVRAVQQEIERLRAQGYHEDEDYLLWTSD